jgi:hypothetical protein
MLTEDYIIRMINLAIAALLQIVGLKKKGDHETALQVIDMTFEQLLGLRASMAKNLEDDRLYFLLTRDEMLDTQRLGLVAELFQHEGDIYAAQGREEESRADYSRALRYYLEVLFNEPDTGESDAGTLDIKQRVDALAGALDLTALGSDTLWPLAGYYEETGAYARAEALLLILAERPEIRAEMLPEVIAFYQRLAAQPEAKLSAGGISPDHVRERLKNFGHG